MQTIKYCIQCTDKISNTIGCFAYDVAAYERGEGFKAITEVFQGSMQFFDWAKSNGYVSIGSYSFTMEKV